MGMLSRKIQVDYKNAAEWGPLGDYPVANDHPSHRDDADLTLLDREGCGALSIGHVPDPARFSADHPEGQFVTGFTLIKNAGSDEYRIPAIFSNYQKTIELIAEDQHARSPVSRYKYAFALMHRDFVRAGQFQRNDNWHRDSIPREILNHHRCTDKLPAQIYLTADAAPTIVQTGGVPDVRRVFTRNAAAEIAPHVRQLAPYEIALLNDYVYHRGVTAEQDATRSFLAVLYVPRQELEHLAAKKSRWLDMFKLT